MPNVNVIQIKVYEIYSLSVLRLFLPCKTRRENVLPLATKFIRHQKYIEDITLFVLTCLTFDEEFWR